MGGGKALALQHAMIAQEDDACLSLDKQSVHADSLQCILDLVAASCLLCAKCLPSTAAHAGT